MTGERLPRGTVAFAVTDVQGSTALLRELGEGWAPLLRTCHALLREAVEEHEGVVVDNEGDGALLAFPHVRDAVRGLVAAQTRLLQHPWPAAAPVRVRMGVHAGPAEPVGGRYVALAVHEAARVGAVAHGGQVLLSEPAALLLEGALPTGADLRDRGRFRVRDFALPVRLYEVTAPGLPTVEAGLRAVPADGGNLPPPAGPLHGRDEVLDGIAAPSRLTTVVGPPGVGKSATALAAARAATAADGVWLVALEQLGELSTGQAVLSALGLPVASGTAPVVAQLAGREALLVLDGADERVAEVVELVAALAVPAPGIRLLVTARAPLGVPGERVVRLEPLAVPPEQAVPAEVLAAPAVRVLLGAGERWDDARYAAALSGLARSAEGLPLALELVGARLAALSPSDLLTRVEAQLARAGRSGALRMALDSAWLSMPEPARLLWQRLSVFAAPVDLDAVEHVCADDEALPEEDVVDALALLVAGSVVLLEQDETGRAGYRLLRSVRAYGGERLAGAGQVAALRDRHARWAAGAVEGWVLRADAEAPPGPLPALAAARDDVLAGLRHLAADDPARVLELVLPLRRLLRESLDLADLLALAELCGQATGSDAVVGLLRGQLSWEREPGPGTLALLESAADAAEDATPAVRVQVLIQLVMAREQFGLEPDPVRDAALQEAARLAADPGLAVRAAAMRVHPGGPDDEALLDRAVVLAEAQAPGLVPWVTGRRLQLWVGRCPAQAHADVERLLLAVPTGGASESTAGLLVAAYALMALGEPEQAGRLAEQAATAAARRRNVVMGFHAAVMRAGAAGAVSAAGAPSLLAEVEGSPVARLGPVSAAMVEWARGWVLAGTDREPARRWAAQVQPADRTLLGWQVRALATAVRDPAWTPAQGLLAHLAPAR